MTTSYSTNSEIVHFSAFASRRSVSRVGLVTAPFSSLAREGCFIFNFLASSI